MENPVENVDLKKYRDIRSGTKKEKHVEARGGIYALDADAVEELCENVRSPEFRNKLIIKLMFHTGVRRQELSDIRVKDVDTDERRIEVHSTKLDSDYTDADPWRSVWYGPSLDPLMARWLHYGGRDGCIHAEHSDYLFPSGDSEKISPETVNRIVKQAAENAGLQEVLYRDAQGHNRYLVTSHTLRHSFAVHCMRPDENGARIDLKTLADLMGHATTETTEKYLHFADSDLKKSRRLYGPD